MKRFSITEAVGEPFRLCFGKPLVTLAWGLVMLLPAVAVLAAFAPLFHELIASGSLFDPDLASDPDMFGDDFGPAMFQFQVWSQLSNLLQYLSLLLVTTAIIRAVFAGHRGDGFAFLRLGKDELHVAVIGVAVVLGAVVAMIVAALLGVAIGFGVWSAVPDPWRWLIVIGYGVALWLGLLLLWGRLSLLAPAAVHYRTFAFEEGWRLGRGQTWRLFAMLLLLVLICIVLGVLLIVLIGVLALTIGGLGSWQDPDAIEAWGRRMVENPGWMIGAGVILALPMLWLQGFSQALMTAPYAYVVKALAAERPAAAAPAEPAPEPQAEANSADTDPPAG